jgi:signal peptidase II
MTKRLVTPLGLYAYVLAAAVVILDQLSKWWVLDVVNLDVKGQVPVLPFLRLTMVMNRGVSYGLLRADGPAGRWMLVGAAFVVVVALVIWARKADRPLFATALGFVIGGAIGNNLVDRPRLGQVVDFLDVSALHFPWVFNLADSAITIGVILLLWDSFFPAKTSDGQTA